MVGFTVNGRKVEVDLFPDTPLLWVLRDHLGLTGTRYGCGNGTCGSCTVLVDGRPRRACLLPVGEMEGRDVVTIEGIPPDHPVIRGWIEERVARCGYCQNGQIVSAVALLSTNPDPDDFAIDVAMSGNVCRCGTYSRIRKGIKRAARLMRGEKG